MRLMTLISLKDNDFLDIEMCRIFVIVSVTKTLILAQINKSVDPKDRLKKDKKTHKNMLNHSKYWFLLFQTD